MRTPSSVRRLLLGAVAALLLATVLGAQDFGDARGRRASGRYQLAHVGNGDGWIILDTETGAFERWIPKGDRFGVIRCYYGRGCPITEKRTESWGLDP